MTSEPCANNPIISRLRLSDASTREETIRHHTKRYELAVGYVQSAGGLAIDLCCGTGYGTAMLAHAGAVAIGVDLSEEAINYARCAHPEARFEHGRVQDFLRTNPREADVVTFFEAIEHLPHPDGHDVLDAVQGALTPDGHLLVSTPRDIRGDVNSDHITQWEFDELHSSLSGRFANVDMFGQDWATGEFVHDNPADASFYVAVCSQPIL